MDWRRAVSLPGDSSSTVLALKEEEEEEGGPENRDYDVIIQKADYEAYRDLKYNNWSEKRTRLEGN